jgi:hypothetical protein
MADKLVQRDRDAVDQRRAVSVDRIGLGRPAGPDLAVIDQHVEGGRLDLHDIGDRRSDRGAVQHAADRSAVCGIDQIAALGGDGGVQALPSSTRPRSPSSSPLRR